MDISPKLFDECTNRYKQFRQIEKKKQKDHDDVWLKIEALAVQNNGKNHVSSNVNPGTRGIKISSTNDNSASDQEESGSDYEEDDVLTKDITRSKFNVIEFF